MPSTAAALDGASLEVGDGEVRRRARPERLAGRRRCCASIAGLHAPDAGRVLLDGVDLARRPPHRRGIGLVFQDHALFPHRDVAGNVAFGLRMRGTPRSGGSTDGRAARRSSG